MSELFWRAYLECEDTVARTEHLRQIVRLLRANQHSYTDMIISGNITIEKAEELMAGLLNSYFEDFQHSIERKARREKGAIKN